MAFRFSQNVPSWSLYPTTSFLLPAIFMHGLRRRKNLYIYAFTHSAFLLHSDGWHISAASVFSISPKNSPDTTNRRNSSSQAFSSNSLLYESTALYISLTAFNERQQHIYFAFRFFPLHFKAVFHERRAPVLRFSKSHGSLIHSEKCRFFLCVLRLL